MRLFLIMLASCFCSSAFASSDEAWIELAANVKKNCLAKVTKLDSPPEIIIDPYGSESFGLAVITGKSYGQNVSYICTMDKRTLETEIGTELPAGVVANPE